MMDFRLPDATEELSRELQRLTMKRSERLSVFTGFEPAGWKEMVDFGLPGLTAAGGTALDLAVGLMVAAEAGLPGPVVEAQLALDSGSEEARLALKDGKVVTSAPPGRGQAPRMAAWGAVADLVVEQASGAVLTTGPLPPVSCEYPLPHGWLDHPRVLRGEDHLAPRRWLLYAAVMAGLGNGALGLTKRHVVDRHQFGRSLSSFQAVQFRLAECLNLLGGLRLCVLDAAWRSASGREDAAVSAALTWLWATRTALTVSDHCHQLFGALGFCQEAGLVALTAQMSWYRLAEGTDEAIRFVIDRRSKAPGTPPSRVLPGFDDYR